MGMFYVKRPEGLVTVQCVAYVFHYQICSEKLDAQLAQLAISD